MRQARPFGVLHNRDFLLLWLGLLVSSAGDWVNYVAMVSVVYRETHSTLALAALRLFHIVPILVLAPVAGVFVDRWSRKRTLAIAPLVAGVAVLVLVVDQAVPLVFLAYGAITVALMFFNPARQAALPSIVDPDDLVPANSLSQITGTSSIVVGGVTGGLLVAHIGPQAAFLVDGLSFLVIAALVLLVRFPTQVSEGAGTSMRAELIEGLDQLRREPTVGTVVVAGAVFIFAPATLLTVGVVFAQATLHGGTVGYGVLLGGLGAGSLLGALIGMAGRRRWRQEVAFVASGLIDGAGVVGLGLSRTLPVAAGMYALAGLGEIINAVAVVTLLQRLVKDRVRGRVFSVASTLDHLAAFASTLVISITTVANVAGIISLAGGVSVATALLSIPALRAAGSSFVSPPVSQAQFESLEAGDGWIDESS